MLKEMSKEGTVKGTDEQNLFMTIFWTLLIFRGKQDHVRSPAVTPGIAKHPIRSRSAFYKSQKLKILQSPFTSLTFPMFSL